MNLSAQPLSLLSLLGIRNGGRMPDTLLTSLMPVLELLDLYLAAQWVSASLTTADIGAASGMTIFQTAGDNELWIIRNASARTDTLVAAGNTYGFWLGAKLASFSANVMVGDYVLGTAGQHAASRQKDKYIFLPPDSSLGIFVGQFTHAVAQPMRLDCEVVKLRI